jgi:small subunit ribosomal protein S16
MAVRIRLARHGAKKRPFYRIVVAEQECRRDGRFIEIVGTYNPLKDPAEVSIKNERVEYWLGQGAKPTDTVKNLLKREMASETAA